MVSERDLWSVAQGMSDSSQGVVVSQDWDNGLVTVNAGGVEQVMGWVSAAPWPGDTVRLLQVGSVTVCWAVHGAPNGTVQSVAGNVATVLGDDGKTYKYPVATGVTLAATNRARLDHAGRLASARYSAEPANSEFVVPPPVPGSGSQRVQRVFRPTQTGNFRGGRWYDGPLSISDTRSAFMFYDRQIADTIPDTAVIHTFTLHLDEVYDNVPGVPSRLGYHSSPTNPGSAPGLSGVINVSNGGDIDVMAYASAFVTGAAYGLGFPAGFGYREFASGPSAYITAEYTA